MPVDASSFLTSNFLDRLGTICQRTKLLCTVTFCTSENYKIKFTIIIYVETLWEPPESNKASNFVLFWNFGGEGTRGKALQDDR